MRFILILCLLGLSACTSSEPKKAPKPAKLDPYEPPKGQLERPSFGKIKVFSRYGPVLMSSQPSKEDLKALKERFALKSVVNLRTQQEMTWDEASYVTNELGLKYIHIPMGKPESVTFGTMDAARRAINNPTLRPMLVHCASSNRVGGVWYVVSRLDLERKHVLALEDAVNAGLKNPKYAVIGRKYVDLREPKKAPPPAKSNNQ